MKGIPPILLCALIFAGLDAQPGPTQVVAIDEAHQNTHTFASPPFRGLVQLIQDNGYDVRPSATVLTAASLKGIDVMVIAAPGGWSGPEASLGDAEVTALLEWVRDGGSALVILDHAPNPRNAANLTRAFGIREWHNGYAMVDVRDAGVMSNIIFWRRDVYPAGEPSIGVTGPGGGKGYQGTDAVLADHAISNGRTPAERVRRVATFGGSAFQAPPRAVPILTLPSRTLSFTPPETPGAKPVFNGETPRSAVDGWLQGAVMTLGKGRVALFGETGLFSAGPASDNRQFVLNVIHWLSGKL